MNVWDVNDDIRALCGRTVDRERLADIHRRSATCVDGRGSGTGEKGDHHEHSTIHHDLETRAFQLLRTVFTIAPIAFGLDKFANLLTDWTIYLAPWINDLVPGNAQAGHVRRRRRRDRGRLPRSRAPRFGAFVVAAWLAGIIVNLLTLGDYYDVALRDFGLLVARPRPGSARRLRATVARPCLRHRRRRPTSHGIVIIGAGLAAAKAAERPARRAATTARSRSSATSSIRRTSGRRSRRTTCMGKSAFDDARRPAADWYAEHDVDLLTGRTVDARSTRPSTTRRAGSTVRRIALRPGSCSPPARARARSTSPAPSWRRTLRRVADTERAARRRSRPASSVVVIGGGWIGLEVAAAARVAGVEVTVLEAAAAAALARPRRRARPATSPSCTAARRRPAHRHPRRRDPRHAAPGHASPPAATSIDGRPGPRRASAPPPTPSSPRRPGSRSTTASSSTSSCAPATPTFSRSATSPTPTTPPRAAGAGRALGQRDPPGQGSPRRSILGQDVAYDWQPYFYTDQYDLGMEYVGHSDPSRRRGRPRRPGRRRLHRLLARRRRGAPPP